ncbi:hypothetical protein QE382_002163 [Sphingobacterium zeae]|uniref:Uncharacterized protein n=1 Tax=Sphingobacterium zeae TaxID=1776859 RepID=A0ABU0U5F0_9SPHI|nr:hypothetical protein [Sphingobacterium zeae]MDQ1150179.1 hypothetical protein [Sphingobacterium zeae]
MKHLATFEAAAKTIGLDPTQLPIVSHLPESMQKAPVALFKLSVISAAAWLKEGVKIDWNNRSQGKYFAWWKMRSEDNSVGSASGFSFGDSYFDHSTSFVGSRLVFPTRKALEYVAKKHYALYRDIYVID